MRRKKKNRAKNENISYHEVGKILDACIGRFLEMTDEVNTVLKKANSKDNEGRKILDDLSKIDRSLHEFNETLQMVESCLERFNRD